VVGASRRGAGREGGGGGGGRSRSSRMGKRTIEMLVVAMDVIMVVAGASFRPVGVCVWCIVSVVVGQSQKGEV